MVRDLNKCHDCGRVMDDDDGDGYYCTACIHQHEIEDAIDRGSDLMMDEFEREHPEAFI